MKALPQRITPTITPNRPFGDMFRPPSFDASKGPPPALADPPDSWVSVCRGVTPPMGRNFKVKKVFCFKLDAVSVPEALATTIRIRLMFSVVLEHRRNPGVWARPTPRGRLMGTPGAPLGIPHRLFLWGGPKVEKTPQLFLWGGHPA